MSEIYDYITQITYKSIRECNIDFFLFALHYMKGSHDFVPFNHFFLVTICELSLSDFVRRKI